MCDGARSLVGRRTTVCDDESCSSPGGPDEATEQALAATSAKEACAASNAKGVLAASSTIKAFATSDADMVGKNQIGGEEPVLLIGSPLRCTTVIKSQNVVERHERRPGAQGVITTTIQNANRVSEVKYKNFVEQCVRLPEEKEMYQVPGNAGKPFLYESVGQWSRGLSFVKEMSRSDDVRKTKSELCRAQSTMWSPRRGSCFESKSEYVTEELSMCYCNKDERTKTRVKNNMMMVLRGLTHVAFTDSESAVGSKESNMMGIVRVEEFDTRVLRESRQMEIDVVNQLDVNCKRPRQWASSFPVIPRKWVDVNGEGAEQLEYCSRWCEEELEGSSSNVKFERFDMMSRKITFLDASATCWVVSATSDVTSELPTDEQVVCQDLLG